jgi:hypothetical protein
MCCGIGGYDRCGLALLLTQFQTCPLRTGHRDIAKPVPVRLANTVPMHIPLNDPKAGWERQARFERDVKQWKVMHGDCGRMTGVPGRNHERRCRSPLDELRAAATPIRLILCERQGIDASPQPAEIAAGGRPLERGQVPPLLTCLLVCEHTELGLGVTRYRSHSASLPGLRPDLFTPPGSVDNPDPRALCALPGRNLRLE